MHSAIPLYHLTREWNIYWLANIRNTPHPLPFAMHARNDPAALRNLTVAKSLSASTTVRQGFSCSMRCMSLHEQLSDLACHRPFSRFLCNRMSSHAFEPLTRKRGSFSGCLVEGADFVLQASMSQLTGPTSSWHASPWSPSQTGRTNSA